MNEIEIIYDFEDDGLNFTALKRWTILYLKNLSFFYKIRYANRLSVCGFYTEAKSVLNELDLTKIKKEDKYLYYQYKGDHYTRIGKLKQARLMYSKSLKNSENSTVPYIFLANSFASDDLLNKISYLKLALDKEGDVDEVYLNLAIVMMIQDKIEEALLYVNRGISISPNYDSAENLRNDIINCKEEISTKFNLSIKEKIATAEKYSEDNMHYSAKKLWENINLTDTNEFRKFKYADSLRLCGILNESESVFKEIRINKIPIKFKALYYLYFAQLYYEKYEWEKAKKILEKCITQVDTPEFAYILYSKILSSEEKHQTANEYLLKGIGFFPKSSELYYYFALNCVILNDYSLAIKYIDKSIELDTHFQDAYILKKDIETLITIF